MLGKIVMEPKVIFEIPIYSMSADKFYKKWEISNKDNTKHFLELNDELGDYERWLKRFNLPHNRGDIYRNISNSTKGKHIKDIEREIEKLKIIVK